MKKIFNLLLATCGLALAIHLVMTVVTESVSGTRWSLTAEGRLGLKTLVARHIDPFNYGGEPANSALLLNFRRDEDPRTIDAAESWVYFDFEGRGQPAQTGWVGPGVGLLVMDPDARGLVTSGRQLFGNRTLEGDGRQLTGFAVLAELDDNNDGQIDKHDAAWPRLRVWLDRKPDGRVGLNELYSLDQLKIKALELKAQPENRPLRNLNYLHSRGFFVYSNGRRGSLDEVFFQQRAGLREYSDGLVVSPEVEAMAPDLRGEGRMRNLRPALMQSPKLMDVYRRYQSAQTRAEQLELMDDLLDAWAIAGGTPPTLAERLGDRYDISANCLEGMNQDHLRRLEVMEAWWGTNFYRLPHELYPGQELGPGVIMAEDGGRTLAIVCPNENWQELIRNYDRLSTYVYERLLKATRLKRFYDQLGLSKKADFSLVLAMFDHDFLQNPDRALDDLMEFRLDLARDRADAVVGSALDDYIKARLAQATFTADQRGLYGRLPASARPETSSAESGSSQPAEAAESPKER